MNDIYDKINKQDYVDYTFYDESGKYIAIVKDNISKEMLEKLQEEYDEVKYKE